MRRRAMKPTLAAVLMAVLAGPGCAGTGTFITERILRPIGLVGEKTGRAVGTVGKDTGKAVGTAGKKTGKAVGTAGKETGKAVKKAAIWTWSWLRD